MPILRLSWTLEISRFIPKSIWKSIAKPWLSQEKDIGKSWNMLVFEVFFIVHLWFARILAWLRSFAARLMGKRSWFRRLRPCSAAAWLVDFKGGTVEHTENNQNSRALEPSSLSESLRSGSVERSRHHLIPSMCGIQYRFTHGMDISWAISSMKSGRLRSYDEAIIFLRGWRSMRTGHCGFVSLTHSHFRHFSVRLVPSNVKPGLIISQFTSRMGPLLNNIFIFSVLSNPTAKFESLHFPVNFCHNRRPPHIVGEDVFGRAEEMTWPFCSRRPGMRYPHPVRFTIHFPAIFLSNKNPYYKQPLGRLYYLIFRHTRESSSESLVLAEDLDSLLEQYWGYFHVALAS